MGGDPDFAAEGLLDGLGGAARAGREALLRRLHAEGVGLEDLRRAVAEERLVLLPLERVLGGSPDLTFAEVAAQTGVDPELLQSVRRAIGLPTPEDDARVLGRADVEAAERMQTALELGLPAEGLLDLNRVLGRAMAQVAAAMRQLFGDAYLEAGDSEDDVARRFAERAEALLPNLGPALQNIFALQLRELLRGDAIDAAALHRGALAEDGDLAVAFADLVGFTYLGGRVPPAELGRIARRLEELTSGLVHPPVRLVKTIGDAVMLVAPRPGPLLDLLLELVAAAEREDEDFPQVRAGIAWGNARERDGDVFGHAVNLASRITALARPSSVLADEGVHDALSGDGGHDWSFAGGRKVKGVQGEVKVFRARRDAR